MSEPLSVYQQLEQSLQSELQCVQGFLSVLQQESNTLAQGAEPEQLNEITTKKNNYVTELSGLAVIRNRLLKELDLETDREGLIELAQQRSELLEVIQSLLDTTAQASILNHGNGQIVDRFLNNHQQALDVLYHLTGRSQIYDAKGRSKPTTRPRTGHTKRV